MLSDWIMSLHVCVFFQIRISNTVVSIETSAFLRDDGRFLTKIESISGLIKNKKTGDTANESYKTALKKELLMWEGVILSHNV